MGLSGTSYISNVRDLIQNIQNWQARLTQMFETQKNKSQKLSDDNCCHKSPVASTKHGMIQWQVDDSYSE